MAKAITRITMTAAIDPDTSALTLVRFTYDMADGTLYGSGNYVPDPQPESTAQIGTIASAAVAQIKTNEGIS